MESYLQEKKLRSGYIGAGSPLSDTRLLLQHLSNRVFNACMYVMWRMTGCKERLQKGCNKTASNWFNIKAPVLNSNADAEEIFKDNRHYSKPPFISGSVNNENCCLLLKEARLAGNGLLIKKPQKYPSGKKPPAMHLPGANMYVEEAIQYVETMFKDNPGKSTPLYIPLLQRCRQVAGRFLHTVFMNSAPMKMPF